MGGVTEEVVNEGHAMVYANDLVLICETKEEARHRFEPGEICLRVRD